MKNRLWIIFLVTVILVTSLTACQKSASQSLVATPTATNAYPFPTPLPGSAMNSILAGTQTAEALLNPNNLVAISMTPVAISGETNTTPVAVITTAVNPPSTQVVTTAQPTSTKIIVPTSTPGRPATYTLQAGEYPFCIARRFNVDASELLSLNGLNLNSRPSAGTVLQIPQSGSWSSGSRALKDHPTTYTVASGDTIYSVACVFGDVDPNAIIIANSLKSPYTLTTGQTIDIP